MNARFLRRLAVAFAAYAAVAFAVVLLQFSNRSGFTLGAGSMVVSGNWKDAAQAESTGARRNVAGSLSVFFGGMEFRLSEQDGLASVDKAGKAVPQEASFVESAKDRVVVGLSDGSIIGFSTRFEKGGENLYVQVQAAATATEQRIPFRPLRSTRIAELQDGRPAVVVGDDTYTFSGAKADGPLRVLTVQARRPYFSYGKVVPAATPTLVDFSSGGPDKASYNRAVQRWVDTAYGFWEREMSGSPKEDLVVAYVTESLRRGAYRSAVATTPKNFLDSPNRTFRSSPYFGKLDLGLRTMVASERETLGRISRMVNERSLDLFQEPGLIAYLNDRSSKTLVDEAAAIAKEADPSSLVLPSALGVLECWVDWKELRDGDNPFGRLVDQAEFVILGSLRKTADAVYVTNAERSDTAFGLRCGQILQRYGLASGKGDWASLGRWLVVSALANADATGSLPATVAVPEAKDGDSAGTERLPGSAVYTYVKSDDEGPRAVSLSKDGGAGLWTWTAAEDVRARWEGSELILDCDFPAGETHYMLVRGIKPFQKIQIYGLDYRTDPRFERWDSSGYVYSADDQTLLLKMKHKVRTETVRIFY